MVQRKISFSHIYISAKTVIKKIKIQKGLRKNDELELIVTFCEKFDREQTFFNITLSMYFSEKGSILTLLM